MQPQIVRRFRFTVARKVARRGDCYVSDFAKSSSNETLVFEVPNPYDRINSFLYKINDPIAKLHVDNKLFI